jgi:hypothetical protein
MTLEEEVIIDESLPAWLFESNHPEVSHIDPKWGHFSGDPNGLFVFQSEDKTLMHVGDTILGPVYDKLHKKFSRIDVLTFPLWSKGTGGDLEAALKIEKKLSASSNQNLFFCTIGSRRTYPHGRLQRNAFRTKSDSDLKCLNRRLIRR